MLIKDLFVETDEAVLPCSLTALMLSDVVY